MMSARNPDVYEVTCLDCGTTKSYFTSQGVAHFKMNHPGHNIRVNEGGAAGGEQPGARASRPDPLTWPERTLPPQRPEEPTVETPQTVEKETPPVDSAIDRVRIPEPVKLTNLVVDAVDNGEGRVVEVYGVAGGRETFTKTFYMRDLGNLNLFLESGGYTDPSTLASYGWTPEKIDLSEDVVKILDEQPADAGTTEVARVGVPVKAQGPGELPTEEPEKMVDPDRRPDPSLASLPPAKSVTEGALLGKLSYVQPGDEYALESMRVSRALRKFRWNTELPYVIGAMFDDLLSVQSQMGAVKDGLIEAVASLGYTFVAVEAPSGTVTAWFRKNEGEPDGETERTSVSAGCERVPATQS